TPRVAGVVGAQDIPVLLHEEHVGPRWVHGDSVHAVADLRVRVGNALRGQAAVDRPPALAGIVTAEGAGRRDGDEDSIGMLRIENDRMETHAAGTGRPIGGRRVLAEAGKLLPALTGVLRAKQGGVFGTRIDGVRIVQRGLEVPDSLELKGTR